jgi:hypothetical protein
MLTNDDLDSLRGVRIADAELREREYGQVLRLYLDGGGILALTARADGLNLADEAEIP